MAVFFTILHFALSVLIYQWAIRSMEPDFEPLSGKVVIFRDAMALGINYDSFHIYVAACKRVCAISSKNHVNQS